MIVICAWGIGVCCLRKLQLRADEWLRQVVPSHESMTQMQQEDLTPALTHFGANAPDYLVMHMQKGHATGKQKSAFCLAAVSRLKLI